MLELPNLEILGVEDLSATMVPLGLRYITNIYPFAGPAVPNFTCTWRQSHLDNESMWHKRQKGLTEGYMHRCPQLKTLVMNGNGGHMWGQQFAQLPMSALLANVQIKIQAGMPEMEQATKFWQGLKAAQGLTTLKIIFSAFQTEHIHGTVTPLPQSSHSAPFVSAGFISLIFSCRNQGASADKLHVKATVILPFDGLTRSNLDPNQPWARCSVFTPAPASRSQPGFKCARLLPVLPGLPGACGYLSCS